MVFLYQNDTKQFCMPIFCVELVSYRNISPGDMIMVPYNPNTLAQHHMLSNVI